VIHLSNPPRCFPGAFANREQLIIVNKTMYHTLRHEHCQARIQLLQADVAANRIEGGL
jgi:hypothetical protein